MLSLIQEESKYFNWQFVFDSYMKATMYYVLFERSVLLALSECAYYYLLKVTLLPVVK